MEELEGRGAPLARYVARQVRCSVKPMCLTLAARMTLLCPGRLVGERPGRNVAVKARVRPAPMLEGSSQQDDPLTSSRGSNCCLAVTVAILPLALEVHLRITFVKWDR